MPPRGSRKAKRSESLPVSTYTHSEAKSLLRPDVGTQAQFKKKKPPKEYRYDPSLSPALEWDGGNAARELGEWLLDCIERASRLEPPHTFDQPQEYRDARGQLVASVTGLQDAVEALRRLGRPFLNWAGKGERLSFSVPTLPLFVHERLSTKAILETLKGHKRQMSLFDLFRDPERPIFEQVLRAYEYANGWTNRMILGDSLVVMNSLLEYEGLGGQVQMIYIDPPYGVKFGSNFQPFVRKREVQDSADDDMTREPEMVRAYRDTWDLSLHSYLTYMRDRLYLAHDLLGPPGSIFVQISDENLHHVRELMDEVFGPKNFNVVICYRRLGTMIGAELKSSAHYLVWYAKDRDRQKFRKVFEPQVAGVGTGDHFTQLENTLSGEIRPMTREERSNPNAIPIGWKPYQLASLQTYGVGSSARFPIQLGGRAFVPGPNKAWRTTEAGVQELLAQGRLQIAGNTVRYKQYLGDFPYAEVGSIWSNAGRDPENYYVVQTPTNIIERCMLMTTDPGDLVLDPTCGSGTTAYVAEQWGRRWITIDVSRVPLALARQRLLTATFPYYELKDEGRGPAGGFVYRRKQNSKGEEVGGVVPHITLKSIANNEQPEEEVLVDRPEEVAKVTRVTGPFAFEASIPTPVDWEADARQPGDDAEDHASFLDRMLETLRRSPVLHVGGGKAVTLYSVRPPAKSLTLSAEALVEATAPGQRPSIMDAVDEAQEKDGLQLPLSRKPVAIVFGPENGAVSEKLVYEAAREAHAKGYTYLYVIGFAIQPNARQLVDESDQVVGIPALYIQATPDLIMGDLLKNMRSSQIFSVCGLPDIQLHALKAQPGEAKTYTVELLGLDVFDPATMQAQHRQGEDVPAWFLDTDYNDLCFHVSQAFFPRTGAWDSLKRSLKGIYDDSVWEHLAGTVSAPFEAGDHGQVAVKVIDDRGNELMVVKSLREARP